MMDICVDHAHWGKCSQLLNLDDGHVWVHYTSYSIHNYDRRFEGWWDGSGSKGCFLCKPGNPSLLLRIHIKTEGENRLCEVVLRTYNAACNTRIHTHVYKKCTCTLTCTRKIIWFLVFKGLKNKNISKPWAVSLRMTDDLIASNIWLSSHKPSLCVWASLSLHCV